MKAWEGLPQVTESPAHRRQWYRSFRHARRFPRHGADQWSLAALRRNPGSCTSQSRQCSQSHGRTVSIKRSISADVRGPPLLGRVDFPSSRSRRPIMSSGLPSGTSSVNARSQTSRNSVIPLLCRHSAYALHVGREFGVIGKQAVRLRPRVHVADGRAVSLG